MSGSWEVVTYDHTPKLFDGSFHSQYRIQDHFALPSSDPRSIDVSQNARITYEIASVPYRHVWFKLMQGPQGSRASHLVGLLVVMVPKGPQ
jgi:hypothetical protein